jgi:hypothetical protein
VALTKRALFVLAILLSCRLPGFSQNCTTTPVIDSGPSVVVNGPTSATITWTTTGYNSSSMVTYGNDNTTLGRPDIGYWWVKQDQSTGVARHSITISNLETGTRYKGAVVSECFTDGSLDFNKRATVPATAGGSGLLSFTAGTTIVAADTLSYQFGGIIPVQDGTHHGFHAAPGFGVIVPLVAYSTVIPASNYYLSNGTIEWTLSGSLITNYSLKGVLSEGPYRNIWNGDTITCNQGGGNQYQVSCSVDIQIPTNVPTSGTACTNNSAAVDLGSGNGCAYPVTISAASGDSHCSGIWTCSKLSITVWIIVQTPPGIHSGNSSGVYVPCKLEANKTTDKCQWQAYGKVGTDNYFSWERQISAWGTFYGQTTPIWNPSAQANWFYNGDSVDKQYGDRMGNTATWYGYARHITHGYRDRVIYPIVQEATTFLSLTQARAPITPGNSICRAVSSSNGDEECGSMTINCGTCDLSTMVSGLATGQTYIATVTGGGVPTNSWTMSVLAADNKAKTFTVESQTPTVPGRGASWKIVRELNGIQADPGSDATHIICAACDFTNVAANQVAYVPTQISPTWSTATARGATIASISSHTITLTSPGITGFAGSRAFQIRKYQTPQEIYNWAEGLYDDWSRNGDYISADAIMFLTRIDEYMVHDTPDYQREQSLILNTCRRALDIQNTIGTNTSVTPNSYCTTSSLRKSYLDVLFSMIDYQVNNGMGNGTASENFLMGLEYWALIHWQADPVVADSSDLRFNYWIKKLADYQYVMGYQVAPQYYHEWAYILEDYYAGFLDQTDFTLTSGGRAVSSFWSEEGLIWPVYAWLFYKTGNGTIANSNGTHYSTAFNDMFRYGTVYSAGDWPYHGKTLGQQGLWIFDALTWMTGTDSDGVANSTR